MTYADSSFLVSLYIQDFHTETAKSFLAANPNPLILTSFQNGNPARHPHARLSQIDNGRRNDTRIDSS